MKKTISLILAILMLTLVFTGCDILNFGDRGGESESEFESNTNEIKETDVWDGAVATAFSGGNGSEASPYQISTGAELAFLAKQVNSGNTYENESFILTNDIDLNNIEWKTQNMLLYV